MSIDSKRFRMIAKTISGLENVLASEISALGASGVKPVMRGVEFFGDKKLLYKANYLSRTALRIIVPIAIFRADNEQQLYDGIGRISWGDYLDVNGTFSVDGVTSYSNITHSKFLALKTKDAIADQFRNKFGRRPNVRLDNADLVVNVRIFRNEATVSIDSSGESLHKRGYRKATGPAPLSEVLAAGMIYLTDWDKKSTFIDPMCGSGTIPIEAALIARNIPAGYFRKDYCFMHWKDFDRALWDSIVQEAMGKIRHSSPLIIGSDRSGRVLSVARENAESARLAKDIAFRGSFFADLEPPEGKGVIIMNPPYNERLKTEDVIDLYRSIGDTLKRNFTGYQAWIISANIEALKFVGLRPTRNLDLNNGQLECKYSKFEIYEGSKKRIWSEKKSEGEMKPKTEEINQKLKRKRLPKGR
jgi:putative N6-adenine-specific DNA methylase